MSLNLQETGKIINPDDLKISECITSTIVSLKRI